MMSLFSINNFVDTITIGIFGPNYLLFLVTVLLTIAFIIFAYRWTGPEAILAVNVLSFAIFSSSVNPLFTTIMATVIVVDAALFILFVWRQLAQG